MTHTGKTEDRTMAEQLGWCESCDAECPNPVTYGPGFPDLRQ